jgi:CRISPR-associated exonuclease Cas4
MSARSAPAPTFAEDDLLPLSALQHLLFCERQCALIHVEGLWLENRLTVEGRHLHERADAAGHETRGPVRTVRGLALRSLRLGLIGKADVVEFHEAADGAPARVVPVEYKRGRPKPIDADRVQLCAQALCLEEMLDVAIPAGALFYGTPRRRTEVLLDAELRRRTEEAAARLRALVRGGITPLAEREAKCDACSLLPRCLPQAVSRRRSASRWLDHTIAHHVAAGDAEEPS